MYLLLFFLLAGCTVKSEENNYYVIQMPDATPARRLQVYWNVPTMQCNSKRIPFKNLSRFGILQNKEDSFRGEIISILYDPGIFPALFRNGSSGDLRYRNGGVPQEGDLDVHLQAFRSVLEQSIPDSGFRGIGIIDFESWRPVFRQNFGDVLPYKSVSYEIERRRHWWWPQQWVHAEAKKRFEEAARRFMQTTLSIAKQMRPNARWGYYGFPYCFNMRENTREACADNVQQENDGIDWLWSESTALNPSVYSSKELSSLQLSQLIRGRVKEAARVRRRDTPILPYFWFRYRDAGFLSPEDLHTALKTFNQSEASGFIVWGSSNDVNTVDKCKRLLNYIENFMGPAIAKYTGADLTRDESIDDNNNEFNYLNNETKIEQFPLNENSQITTEKPFDYDNSSYNDTRKNGSSTEYVSVSNNETDNANFSTVSTTEYFNDRVTTVDDKSDERDELQDIVSDRIATSDEGLEAAYLDKEEVAKTMLNPTIDNESVVLEKLNESILIDLILNALFNNVESTTEESNCCRDIKGIETTETEFILENLTDEATEKHNLVTSTHVDLDLRKINNSKDIPKSAELPEVTIPVTEKYLETSTHLETGVLLKNNNISEKDLIDITENTLRAEHTVFRKDQEINYYLNTDIPPRLFRKINGTRNHTENEYEYSDDDGSDLMHYTTSIIDGSTTLVTDEYHMETSTYINTDIPPRLHKKLKKDRNNSLENGYHKITNEHKNINVELRDLETSTYINTNAEQNLNNDLDNRETNEHTTNISYLNNTNELTNNGDNGGVTKTYETTTEEYSIETEITSSVDVINDEVTNAQDDGLKNMFYNQNTFYGAMNSDLTTTGNDLSEATEDDSEYSDFVTEKFYIFNETMHEDLLKRQVTTEPDPYLQIHTTEMNSTESSNNTESTPNIKTSENDNEIQSLPYSSNTKGNEKSTLKDATDEVNKKGVPRSTNEDAVNEKDFLLEIVTSSSADQVVVRIV